MITMNKTRNAQAAFEPSEAHQGNHVERGACRASARFKTSCPGLRRDDAEREVSDEERSERA
ncbi:hypothetical protein QTH87_25610 [Variovorax sp. J22P168]|uniref:hypothetical protein n=1 Tax=Variovorax jilinensis TaxID=3053513 RepID=UPI0025753715|nr:hypothetical protein [Variovorax sp. J22P168]MDM0015842.1 hypothetical protein [Variovorax sp. J22P168]